MGIDHWIGTCLDGPRRIEVCIHYHRICIRRVSMGKIEQMSKKRSIMRARERLSNWSARGDNCPLCKKDFQHGCNHSVEQAHKRLEENIIKAIVDRRLKKLGVI